MMTIAGLSKPFCFHSMAHSCYLINYMPCKSLHLSSPYEMLFHKTPDLTHLKVFCSSCYPYLRPYARDKLDHRTFLCVFLGYALGYKGIICYSPTHNKMWVSRHVIHDEICFPLLKDSSGISSPVDLSTFLPKSYVSCSSQLSSLSTELMGVTGCSSHESQGTPVMNNMISSGPVNAAYYNGGTVAIELDFDRW